MESTTEIEKLIHIELVVRPTCQICKKVRRELEHITKPITTVELSVINADTAGRYPGKYQPYVTPAIWVNNSLWYLGGFDSTRFITKLNQLNQ